MGWNSLKDLADRRASAQSMLAYLSAMQTEWVDEQLVKEALLRGASEDEVAAELSISKAAVERFARIPTVHPFGPPASSPARVSGDQLAEDFSVYVWGSLEAVNAATGRCLEYDTKRLPID